MHVDNYMPRTQWLVNSLIYFKEAAVFHKALASCQASLHKFLINLLSILGIFVRKTATSIWRLLLLIRSPCKGFLAPAPFQLHPADAAHYFQPALTLLTVIWCFVIALYRRRGSHSSPHLLTKPIWVIINQMICSQHDFEQNFQKLPLFSIRQSLNSPSHKSCSPATEFGMEATRNQWLATFPSTSTVGAYPACLDISDSRGTSGLVPLPLSRSGHLRHRAETAVEGHPQSLIKEWRTCFPLP